MSLELWNTLATVGQFLVITATAIAALLQLRHMRGSNQIAVLTELRASQQTPEYLKAANFVYNDLAAVMEDPAFRYQLLNRSARTPEGNELISHIEIVGDFYENIGMLAKTGLLDRRLLMDILSAVVVSTWNALAGVTAIWRARYGNAIFENFEYITVLAQDWRGAHPDGDYPAGVRRITLANKWQADDERYAAKK